MQEIHRFGQTRPSGQQRLGGELFCGVNTRGVVWVVPIDEGDKRTCIGKGHDRSRFCSRSPSEKRWPQFSDNASVVPSIIPIWSERKSNRLGSLSPGACFPSISRGRVIVITSPALSLFWQSSKGVSKTLDYRQPRLLVELDRVPEIGLPE